MGRYDNCDFVCVCMYCMYLLINSLLIDINIRSKATIKHKESFIHLISLKVFKYHYMYTGLSSIP